MTSIHRDTGSDRHGYFVPLVMLVVVAVIIFATFFDKSVSKQVADVISPAQKYEASLPANASAGAGITAPAEITPDKSTVSDLAALDADVERYATTNDKSQREIAHEAATKDQHLPGHGRPESHAYPDTESSPLGMSGKRSRKYNKIMQVRREAYEAWMQTPGQHRQMMRGYRAVVLKRIRQDRRARHQHIHNTYRKGQHRQQSLINRSEPTHEM